MKVLASLALCGLVAVAYAAFEAQPEMPVAFAFTPKCPPGNGELVELIANPDNCTSYYACNYGNAIAMSCNPGLHFNPELKVCDFPERACCDPAYDPQNNCNRTI